MYVYPIRENPIQIAKLAGIWNDLKMKEFQYVL